MSEAEFMEDGAEYCDNEEDTGCKRQSCDGCLCTDWCPLFHDPFID